MSEDCGQFDCGQFDIDSWRKAFDADMEAVKASMEAVAAQMQPYIHEIVREVLGDGILTAEDAVMLWEFHIRADGDIAKCT